MWGLWNTGETRVGGILLLGVLMKEHPTISTFYLPTPRQLQRPVTWDISQTRVHLRTALLRGRRVGAVEPEF